MKVEQASIDFISRAEADLEAQRLLTVEQRGRILRSVCSAAARLERSRLANGFAPSQPAPWPDSTWEFLRKAMRDVRR